MMRSPTRTTTASRSSADAVVAARAMARARTVFFIAVFGSDVQWAEQVTAFSLFVGGLWERTAVAEGEAAGEYVELHLLAAPRDELSHAVAERILSHADADQRRGGFGVECAGRAAVVDAENVKAGVGLNRVADFARLQFEDLFLEHLRQLAAADESDLAAAFGVRRAGVLARQFVEGRAAAQLFDDVVGERFVVDEDLSYAYFLAAAEVALMLLVIRLDVRVRRLLHLGRAVREEF